MIELTFFGMDYAFNAHSYILLEHNAHNLSMRLYPLKKAMRQICTQTKWILLNTLEVQCQNDPESIQEP